MKNYVESRRFEVDINDYNEMQKAELLKKIKSSKRVNHYAVLDNKDLIIIQTKNKYSLNTIADDLEISRLSISKVEEKFCRYILSLLDLNNCTVETFKSLDTNYHNMIIRAFNTEMERRDRIIGEYHDVKH